MKNRLASLVVIILAWFVITMTPGCVNSNQKPSTLGDQIIEMGQRWVEGEEMVQKGEKMIKEGETQIKEGKQLIEEGKQLMKGSETELQQRGGGKGQ